jgi:hypothetical protein
MKIRTWGCSITTGYGMNTTYTNVLSDTLQCEGINTSKDGIGNDWIFHNIVEYLNSVETETEDWHIVQWSGPMRRLHQSISGKEWTVYPDVGDSNGLGPKWEPMGSKHTLHYMYCVQELFQTKGIRNWIFWNYFPLDESVKGLNTYNGIEWNNFVDIDRAWMIKNNYVWDGEDGGHPNIEGIYWIANTLLNKMGYNIKLEYKDYKYRGVI